MIEVTVTPAVAILIAAVPAEIPFIVSVALWDTADAATLSMAGAPCPIAAALATEAVIIMGTTVMVTTMVAAAADTSVSQAYIWNSVVGITDIDSELIT